MNMAKAGAGPKVVRCAIYTRKSTEEGLEQAFNSLDAQREASEAYIASQKNEGWTCLATRYDDGGFTGGNMDRPALQRLLADIEAGQIDSIVVYKLDRFSRSLLDFAKMMETLDKHQVAFVSITQQFSTGTSMGRLVLNVLLSFAQFEREIIAERTRDKIAATRRKGKWTGGTPILGYDVDSQANRLVVNVQEAERVRAIFELYLEHQALVPLVEELERRGWVNKCWRTKAGHQRGGLRFTKTNLYRLLTNVSYAGRVRYKTEVHAGEQPAIVDAETFERLQALLRRNGPGCGRARTRGSALLQGVLRCVPCGCSMTPAHTKRGNRRYRYYTCTNAQKRGWQACPSRSIPAAEMDKVVLAQSAARARTAGRARPSRRWTARGGLTAGGRRWRTKTKARRCGAWWNRWTTTAGPGSWPSPSGPVVSRSWPTCRQKRPPFLRRFRHERAQDSPVYGAFRTGSARTQADRIRCRAVDGGASARPGAAASPVPGPGPAAGSTTAARRPQGQRRGGAPGTRNAGPG